MNNPRQGDEEAEISEVNVVPLCDVSLVLLIILMVISPMMAQSRIMLGTAAQAKDLPPPDKEPPPPSKPDLVLTVGLGTDKITVGDQTFDNLSGFMSYMSQTLASRTDKKVFLSPTHDVTNGKVVNMLELLKQLGAESVALIQHDDTDMDTQAAAEAQATNTAPPAPTPQAARRAAPPRRPARGRRRR